MLMDSTGRNSHQRHAQGTLDGLSYRTLSLSLLSIFISLYLLRSFNDLHYSLDLDSFAGPRVSSDGQTTGGAQGNSAGSCRMTWMSPSYQPVRSVVSQFNYKYSLYLYREQEWDIDHNPSRSPVLFIPGNAGSFRQVRSLASVTATTYFQSPRSPYPQYLTRRHPGLDFFTLDFNDEFSAFHGQTLVEQAEFANDAIRTILSIYQESRRHTNTHLPVPSSVLIMGHSMGGVLARKMLTMPNYVDSSINTIISISSPHSIPPITFESGIERIYESVNGLWRQAFTNTTHDPHPSLQEIVLVSIAGGSSDTTISSDSSSLLSLAPSTSSLTVFTTGIPGVWTPMDHLAILWCNQLAIVLAKALLHITDPLLPAQVGSVQQRLNILKSHLIDGHGIVDMDGDLDKFHVGSLATQAGAHHLHPPLQSLRLTHADLDANSPALQTHIIPLPEKHPPGLEFTLLTSLVAHHRLNVLACNGSFESHLLQSCSSIAARALQILPRSQFNLTPIAAPGPHDRAAPPPVSTFIQMPLAQLPGCEFIAIQVSRSPASGRPDQSEFLVSEFRNLSASTLSASASLAGLSLLGGSFGLLGGGPSLVSEVHLPSLVSSPLAYKLRLLRPPGCEEGLFAPLMRQQTPLLDESKFHPNIRAASVATHFSTSYTPIRILGPPEAQHLGLRLTFWLDPAFCGAKAADGPVPEVQMTMDFYETLRRTLLRYRTALVAFPLGVMAMVFSIQLRGPEEGMRLVCFSAVLWGVRGGHWVQGMGLVGALQCVQAGVLQSAYPAVRASGAPFALLQPPWWLADFLLGQHLCLFAPLAWLLLLASVGWAAAVYLLVQIAVSSLAVGSLWLAKSLPGILRPSCPSPVGPTGSKMDDSRGLLLLLVGLGLFNIGFAPYHFTFVVLSCMQLVTTVRSLMASLQPPRLDKAVNADPSSRYRFNLGVLLLMLWLLPISLTTCLAWLRSLQEGNYHAFSGGRSPARVAGFMGVCALNHLDLAHRWPGQRRPRTLARFLEPGRPGFDMNPWRLRRAVEISFQIIGCMSVFYGIRHTYRVFDLFNLGFLLLASSVVLAPAAGSPARSLAKSAR